MNDREECMDNLTCTVDDLRMFVDSTTKMFMDAEDVEDSLSLVHGLTSSIPDYLTDLEDCVMAFNKACDHDWIDMSNEVVQSGMWCPKCKSVGTLDTEALTVLTLDELRNKYPWVNWKS